MLLNCKKIRKDIITKFSKDVFSFCENKKYKSEGNLKFLDIKKVYMIIFEFFIFEKISS